MNDDFYQFKVGDLDDFVRAIGISARDNNGQKEFLYCPYCHGGRNKDQKTFSVSLSTGQFECKRATCGVKGNMITLAKDFADHGFALSKEVTDYYNINNSGKKFKKFRDAHRITESKEPAIEYMKTRGISEETTRKYEITCDKKNSNILIFPFKDENGELQFVKYRNTNPDPGKSKEWCIKGAFKKILFGMNHCEDFTTLVITEGQIDSLSLAEAGIKNAVSVPTGKNGFTWRANVWNWLVKFEEIVVFGDHEHGHITLAEQICGFFPKRVRVVKIEDYQGCKDANEILQKKGKEALVTAVENAETVVSYRIKNLAEVENIDMSKLKAYPTGFETLDKAIGGGFHAGEVDILTGKCGEGKSTFASQIVARMIQNGLKCFCYSGELPDWMFKAWIDYQICGSVTPKEASRNAVSKWYDKKCYIYDNSAVVDEEESLFKLIDQAIRSLGCKFILIDNLMTAMEDKPEMDLFRQQSKFLTELTKKAKGYDVIILLIAHPRKGKDDSNDSISGSGDITNRANLVLRYQRDKEDNEFSKVSVTKNRTTGKLLQDKNAIRVWYDENSMRIKEEGAGDFVEFLDQKLEDGFVDSSEGEEIPF